MFFQITENAKEGDTPIAPLRVLANVLLNPYKFTHN